MFDCDILLIFFFFMVGRSARGSFRMTMLLLLLADDELSLLDVMIREIIMRYITMIPYKDKRLSFPNSLSQILYIISCSFIHTWWRTVTHGPNRRCTTRYIIIHLNSRSR